MDPALRTAASGMSAQQTRTEVIANNLANVNTTGFKRSRAQFEDLLYQTVQGGIVAGPDAQSLPALQVGRGTRLSSIQRVHEQGPIETTARPLDLAIEGEGFFQVQMPNGTLAFTRDGGLSISDKGTLVTAQGYAVSPGIDIPPDASDVTISRTGIVSVTSGAGSAPTEVGRLELARFANPSGLLSLGENLYAQTGSSGEPLCGFPQDDGMGRVVQGSLEGSNVEIVQEMVDMISAMRAYEMNSKVIKNSEQMADIVSSMVR
jgi:flagellar basal-body rod protein FlgG